MKKLIKSIEHYSKVLNKYETVINKKISNPLSSKLKRANSLQGNELAICPEEDSNFHTFDGTST